MHLLVHKGIGDSYFSYFAINF